MAGNSKSESAAEKRIRELEEKLAAVQQQEGSGKDPEMLTRAKQLAKMSWYDIEWALGDLGAVEGLELKREDIQLLRDRLIERKYDSLSNSDGANNILAFND